MSLIFVNFLEPCNLILIEEVVTGRHCRIKFDIEIAMWAASPIGLFKFELCLLEAKNDVYYCYYFYYYLLFIFNETTSLVRTSMLTKANDDKTRLNGKVVYSVFVIEL